MNTSTFFIVLQFFLSLFPRIFKLFGISLAKQMVGFPNDPRCRTICRPWGNAWHSRSESQGVTFHIFISTTMFLVLWGFKSDRTNWHFW